MKRTTTLSTIVKANVIVALGLVLFTRLSGLGWDVAGVLAGEFLSFLAPLVLSFSLWFQMLVSGRLTRPLTTCLLLCLSVFGWPAVFVGAFLREPERFKLLGTSLLLGATFGLLFGILAFLAIKKVKATPKGYPDGGAGRLNSCLSASVAAFLAAYQTVSWLYWDVGRSAGIAVSYDGSSGTAIDFYGSAVGPKAVRLALGKPLAFGSVEQIDLFGVRIHRGFLPYENPSEPSYRVVRRMAFYRTRAGDSILPMLSQIPTLTDLNLRGTRISAAGVRKLRTALPRCKIIR